MNDCETIIEFDSEFEIEMTADFKIFSIEAVVLPFTPRKFTFQTNDSKYEPPNGSDANSILQRALGYIDNGWNPLPIPHREKGPRIKDWHNLKIDRTNVSQHFNGAPQNIGVLLGPKSNNLIDCDFDCPESLIVAPFFMLPTDAIFGRKTKRNSHRLYYSNLADIIATSAIQFKDPNQQADNKVMLAEIRIGGGGKGAQTVFPGSTHPSGETIEWESGCNRDPAQVDGDALIECVKKVAAACLFARYWPNIGGRHDAGLVLGGFLARCGMDLPQIKVFSEAVARAANADAGHAKRCAEGSAMHAGLLRQHAA